MMMPQFHAERIIPRPIERTDVIRCPCCGHKVSSPTLEIVVDVYGVTPLEARILSAIWRGRGMPVQTERIFDAMYADDPDGGPSRVKMYAAFKVALHHLRRRISGSGIKVESAGYGRGYRLLVNRRSHDANRHRVPSPVQG
jgi:hypothetical protein